MNKNLLWALLGVSMAYPIFGSQNPYPGSGYGYGRDSGGSAYSYQQQGGSGYSQGGYSGQRSDSYPQNYGSSGAPYPYKHQQGSSDYRQGGSYGQSSGSYPPSGSQYPDQHQQGNSSYSQGGYSGQKSDSYPPSYGSREPQYPSQPSPPSSDYSRGDSSSHGSSSYPPSSSVQSRSWTAGSPPRSYSDPSSGQYVPPHYPTQVPPGPSVTQSPQKPRPLPPIPTSSEKGTSTSQAVQAPPRSTNPSPEKMPSGTGGHSSTSTPQVYSSLSKRGRQAVSEAITQQEAHGDVGVGKRVEKRSDLRDLQEKGQAFQKDFKDVMKGAHFAGKGVSILASASGDPHAKMAAAALNVAITAVEQLGDKISKLVIGVARFQERSQEILSNTEVLIEDAQKLQEKMKKLQKIVDTIASAGKTPTPNPSSSMIKRAGQVTKSTAVATKNKAVELVDPFTNEKAHREIKLKEMQNSLKMEREKYSEVIKLLQIKILQESLKEIDRKININDTIADLKEETESVYEAAKRSVSANKTKAKKQIKKIEAKRADDLNNLKYYEEYKEKPTETPEQLKQIHADIMKKITELASLTKLSDVRYLQERMVGINTSQVDVPTIAAIFREIDSTQQSLKREIDRLNSEIETLKDDTSSSGG